MPRKLKIAMVLLACVGGACLSTALYARAHPPQHDHSHCIKIAMGMLHQYAVEHGRLPFSANGYGNAILLVATNSGELRFFTAHGYNTKPFEFALKHGTRVPEAECGRVYVQGLPTNCDPNIVILFDKKSRRGGREVDEAGFIRDADWPDFAKRQIELLVAAGIPRRQAEGYYADAKE